MLRYLDPLNDGPLGLKFHETKCNYPSINCNVNNCQQMNEISVIQNSHNGLVGAGKYSGFLGFSYPPSEQMRSNVNSPERSSSPNRDSERLWDLHFDRKSTSESAHEELIPPSREGLAA